MGCVYKIENEITGKVYIGSTNNFNRRKSEHFGGLKRKTHYSKKMQADYDKYGEKSLVMSVIEECKEDVRLDREQYYIDLYDAANKGYNTSESAFYSTVAFRGMNYYGENNPFYGKHHSEETKQRLRDTWERTREERSGWKHKEETIQKMSKKSTRGKNSNATHILQYDLDGNFIKEWDCMADAAEFYKIKSHTSISNCCRMNIGKTKNYNRAKGFIWKYAGEPKKRGDA